MHVGDDCFTWILELQAWVGNRVCWCEWYCQLPPVLTDP